MVSNFKSPIEKEVDRLFGELNAKGGECCENPVTGGKFVWGRDPIAPQKKAAVVRLRAQEWFAINGPRDAPSLPLSHNDVEDYRNARGLAAIVGFYARSLSRQNYDAQRHPPFDDFARGLMAMAVDNGLWGLERDTQLIRRFPARSLEGMNSSGAFWDPPKRNRGRLAA